VPQYVCRFRRRRAGLVRFWHRRSTSASRRWQLRLCGGNAAARCPPIRLAPNRNCSWTSPQRPQRHSAVETLSVARNAGGSARLEWITQNVLALEVPAAGSTGESTSIQTLTAEFTQDPIPYQNPLHSRVIPKSQELCSGAQPTSLARAIHSALRATSQRRQRDDRSIPNVSAVLIYNVAMEPPLPFPHQDRRHARAALGHRFHRRKPGLRRSLRSK